MGLAKIEEEGQQVAKENLEVIKVSPEDRILWRSVEQTVELAESVGEALPLGIAKHSAPTASVLAVSSGVAGSFGPGERDMTSAAATADAELVVEARRQNQ